MRIAVGMMWQESASFSQLSTGRRAFVGLDPAARAIVAKSMSHHVAGFGEVAGQFVRVNTPGPVHADVCALPYAKISRPVLPLDDVTDWR